MVQGRKNAQKFYKRCVRYRYDLLWFHTCLFSGKTELAKQVARYLHKDLKKVNSHAERVSSNGEIKAFFVYFGAR